MKNVSCSAEDKDWAIDKTSIDIWLTRTKHINCPRNTNYLEDCKKSFLWDVEGIFRRKIGWCIIYNILLR